MDFPGWYRREWQELGYRTRPFMKRYEQIVDEIANQIAGGVLRPGERIPSVRKATQVYQVSPGTVLQAYGLLESRRLIMPRSRSGYYVSPRWREQLGEPETTAPRKGAASLDVHDLVFEILESAKSDLLPFASPFLNPVFFPLQKLARFIAIGARALKPENLVASLPPGNYDLRRALARRYLESGCTIRPEEIIITTGASEALHLCLRVTAKPGDVVVVEAPAFYQQLQSIQNLGLKAVQVPVHPRDGMDLSSLSVILKKHPVKVVWLMTNFQNPVGCLMPDAKKKDLVKLLLQREIPLIEDDVYEELYFGRDKPRPAKAFDRNGLVLHCSSFSKALGPGYRVGWTAPGRYAAAVERQKWMTTLSTNMPAQAAMVGYLKEGGYESHLRRLRRNLEVQRDHMLRGIAEYFPEGTRATRPEGGYFLWVELPREVNALRVHRQALARGISIAPGPIFSAQHGFQNFIRLNYGHPWTAKFEKGLASLGKIAQSQR